MCVLYDSSNKIEEFQVRNAWHLLFSFFVGRFAIKLDKVALPILVTAVLLINGVRPWHSASRL
jgi:hypothetical protein